jgi:hypothetical protein
VAADDDGTGVTGMAPDALIMPIDLEPRHNPIQSSPQFFRMVAAGLDFATAHDVDVVNMSLGGVSSGIAPNKNTEKYLAALETMCQSVDTAIDQGVVVVASAGNEGTWGNPEAKPAACPGALTVAALTPTFDRTYWSSYDASVDLGAPGEDILSLDSSVADVTLTPHRFASGTSMAAPVVAGVAALVRELHPEWSADRVADEITATAQDVGIPGRDPESGYGLVDAAAAVGAGGPLARRQNFMATWYQDVWGDRGDLVVVSWTPPHVDPVNGYTVTVHTAEGTVPYDVDGMTVRTEVQLPADGWWTVTAHYAYGDLVTYPMSRDFYDYQRPARLEGVQVSRAGDRMIISWKVPEDRTTVDRIVTYAWYDNGPGSSRKAIKIDQDKPFPTQVSMRLDNRGPWLRGRWIDAHVDIFQVNRDDEGRYLGGRWQSVPGGSAALYGSHVNWIAALGMDRAEVEGGLSEMRAERVCGNDTCALESAVVVVRRGDTTIRKPVVFNTRGTFHVRFHVRDGQKHLTIKVVGPLRLESGPFVRLPIKF